MQASSFVALRSHGFSGLAKLQTAGAAEADGAFPGQAYLSRREDSPTRCCKECSARRSSSHIHRSPRQDEATGLAGVQGGYQL